MSLVALAGHAAQVAFRPVPAAALRNQDLLPRLGLPPLDAALRPRFRRLHAARKADMGPPLELLAARGRSAHPADWLPGRNDDGIPDLYLPWLVWVRAGGGAEARAPLTAETWDAWPPAERIAALRIMRRQEPEAARALVAAKAADETADRRLRLVEMLATGLSDADADLLSGFVGDRSEPVRAAARNLLLRLGREDDDGSRAAELAGMFDVEHSAAAITLRVKSERRAGLAARRGDLMESVSAAGLARALGIDECALARAKLHGSSADDRAFVKMLARTGSLAARRAALHRRIPDDHMPIDLADTFSIGLPAADRQALVAHVAQRDDSSFRTTAACARPALGITPLAAFLETSQLAELDAEVAGVVAAGDTWTAAEGRVIAGLFNLGLLVAADAAASLIARFTAAGLPPADPRLDLLHINAALPSETTP
ncbi:MAG: hypothetical protein JNL66_00375 [Alphaproteobacteria bacterium]|nr:hypothetical protein [Alphaproteobacteria bacterium]